MATEIAPEIAELKAANAANTIRVYAVDMLRAQGFLPSSAERTILLRVADALRWVLETDEPQKLNVPVYDVYNPSVRIGELQFDL